MLNTPQSTSADLDATWITISHGNGAKELLKKRTDAKNSKCQAMSPVQVQESVGDKYASKIKAEDTEQMKNYEHTVKFYGFFASFFGCKMRYDWKMGRHMLFWVASLSLFYAIFAIPYTMWIHVNNGDYARVIEPLGIIGISGSSAAKWYCHLKNWRKIYSLMFHPKKLCLQNVTGVRADIINAGLQRTITVLRIYTIGIILCLSLLAIVPLKLYFIDNVWVLIPFEIIFCDTDTLSGYIRASVAQTELGLYGGAGTIMFGAGFIICISNYAFLINLIEQDFVDLDELWNGSSTTSIAFRHAFIRNICTKMQDLNSYMNTVNEIYETKFFIYFLLSYVAQIICLYEIKENGWIMGYTLFFICFIEMISYCIIGQQISILDDKMCDIINRTNWYSYDLKSQKILLLIIHERQAPNAIKLGPSTLNIMTGIQIVKGIYSYYTVMAEML